MPIVVNLDMMLAKRKMTLKELSEQVDITVANLSVMKCGRSRGIRFSTLDILCKKLRCTTGDILQYLEEEEYKELYSFSTRPRKRNSGKSSGTTEGG